MQSPPKIIHAQSSPDRSIQIEYANGLKASFNFEHFFEYKGFYDFLKDLSAFLKINIEPNGHYIYWINEIDHQEIEIDPLILYSICSHEKIIYDNKVVFDPAFAKNAWK